MDLARASEPYRAGWWHVAQLTFPSTVHRGSKNSILPRVTFDVVAGTSGVLVVGGRGVNRLCACLRSVAWSSAPSFWETATRRSVATSTASMAIAFHVNGASPFLAIVDDPPRMPTESSPHMDLGEAGFLLSSPVPPGFLQFQQGREASFAGHQRRWRALLDDPPPVEHHHAVSFQGRGQPVRHRHH